MVHYFFLYSKNYTSSEQAKIILRRSGLRIVMDFANLLFVYTFFIDQINLSIAALICIITNTDVCTQIKNPKKINSKDDIWVYLYKALFSMDQYCTVMLWLFYKNQSVHFPSTTSPQLVCPVIKLENFPPVSSSTPETRNSSKLTLTVQNHKIHKIQRGRKHSSILENHLNYCTCTNETMAKRNFLYTYSQPSFNWFF